MRREANKASRSSWWEKKWQRLRHLAALMSQDVVFQFSNKIYGAMVSKPDHSEFLLQEAYKPAFP